MSTLLIEGGHQLSGVVNVEGNKNAALPLLAACLLTTEPCVLTNVPRISDVEAMVALLDGLGARAEWRGPGELSIDTSCVDHCDVEHLTRLQHSVDDSSNLTVGLLQDQDVTRRDESHRRRLS